MFDIATLRQLSLKFRVATIYYLKLIKTIIK